MPFWSRVKDNFNVIIGTPAPAPESRSRTKAASRKLTGCSLAERAANMETHELHQKLHRADDKIFNKAGGILGAKGRLVVSADVDAFDVIVDEGKGAGRALFRHRAYLNELDRRGVLREPEDLDSALGRVYRNIGVGALRGFAKTELEALKNPQPDLSQFNTPHYKYEVDNYMNSYSRGR